MPENYGLTAFTGGAVAKQLIARHTPLATRPLLLDNAGGLYTEGCVVFAATVDGPFVKATTLAMPADTDVVAIVSQTIDLTAAPADTLHIGYVGPGEFVRETVLAACAALDAPSAKALEEALLKRGMNLVHSAYAGVPGSV
jgi:hypothetical protein